MTLLGACSSNNGGNTAADAGKTDSAATKAPAANATKEAKDITLGFSQVGAESGWRSANTKSIQDSAKEAGYTLKFSDAQQKQENQIKALRSFIQQRSMSSPSLR